jgi:hypothetical protein
MVRDYGRIQKVVLGWCIPGWQLSIYQKPAHSRWDSEPEIRGQRPEVSKIAKS